MNGPAEARGLTHGDVVSRAGRERAPALPPALLALNLPRNALGSGEACRERGNDCDVVRPSAPRAVCPCGARTIVLAGLAPVGRAVVCAFLVDARAE